MFDGKKNETKSIVTGEDIKLHQRLWGAAAIRGLIFRKGA